MEINSDFRMYLQDELVRRCRQNPRYSMRAFAKSIGLGPSYLSMILNGKRPVTRGTLNRLSKRLDIDPRALSVFSKSLSRAPKASAPQTQASFRQIELDRFQVIAEWYHYAILELLSVRDFCPDARWIARCLGISPAEAKSAVERLMRIGLLSMNKSGRWISAKGNNTNVDNEQVAVARRRLQKQVLEKAIVALEEVPIENRDQSSMTLAIRRDQIALAKEKITRFRRELTAELQAKGPLEEVYHLSISLYPVSSVKREGSKS